MGRGSELAVAAEWMLERLFPRQDGIVWSNATWYGCVVSRACAWYMKDAHGAGVGARESSERHVFSLNVGMDVTRQDKTRQDSQLYHQ